MKPVSVFQKLLDDYGQQFASRWIGIMGDNHVPRFTLCYMCFFACLLVGSIVGKIIIRFILR